MRAAATTEREFNCHLGQRIRDRRVANGASLDVMGRWLMISPQQCAKYELGTSRIHPHKLLILAVKFGVPISDFFLGLPGAENLGGDPVAALRECRAFIARWGLEHHDPRAKAAAQNILGGDTVR